MATMQAIEITRPGSADVLELAEHAIPRPGPGEVLIKVAASGVNRPDVFQRQGNYAPPPGASTLTGLEVAGMLVEGDIDGGNPFGLKHGDAVCALLGEARGDWGDGASYAGGYRVDYEPVTMGGKNFLQRAKVSFVVELSE